jgi:hypothetical protein
VGSDDLGPYLQSVAAGICTIGFILILFKLKTWEAIAVAAQTPAAAVAGVRVGSGVVAAGISLILGA